jgi:hypothetical protein
MRGISVLLAVDLKGGLQMSCQATEAQAEGRGRQGVFDVKGGCIGGTARFTR